MSGWNLLLDLIIALSAALMLGMVFEKLRLGAVIGYILAGIAVGAGSRGILSAQNSTNEALSLMSELGISILLFTTGLEFSFSRLKRLGRSTLAAGISQIIACIIVFAGLATAFGSPINQAIAIGAICAVSSTAIIIRSLRDCGDLDAAHGKVAFGTLLIQDIALVPLVALLTLLGGPAAGADSAEHASVGKVIGISIAFLILLTKVVPRIFRSRIMALNRDLPILLAVITCTFSAWGAHQAGLSPSLGAFLAGMLLADTSYEHQIRSDVAGLRAIFVTLFFLSVGSLIDVRWVGQNWQCVLFIFGLVILAKTMANFLAIRLWKRTTISSFAAALTLANIGELAFVLLQVATANRLLAPFESQLITTVAVLSMVVASQLAKISPRLARKMAIRLVPGPKLVEEAKAESAEAFSGHIVVFGFGTAGKTAVRILGEAAYPVVTIDIDPKFARAAKELGAVPIVGDASKLDLLQELHLNDALAAIVAIPDPRTATQVVALCRQTAPDLAIVARSRVHQFVESLHEAGASLVIGEEQLLGRRLGEEAVRIAIGIDDQNVRNAP